MNSKQFKRYGILFVISAPSGAGKTTLVEALRQTPEFVYSVSCTTRPPRSREIESEDYRFLSETDFHARAKTGEFLEHAKVHGHLYGTLREPIVTNLRKGVDVLIDIDTQGAETIRSCGEEFIRQALADVFIMPPNLDELRRRLTRRGTETAEQIEALARLPLHHHQPVCGRRPAKISTDHRCGAIFEQAPRPGVTRQCNCSLSILHGKKPEAANGKGKRA
jgi:guanylate kinase